MKFYTTLPKKLKPHFDREMDEYRSQFNSGHLSESWNHLERAHVIGQRYPFAHSYVHWKMFQFGIKIKNTREIFGQIPRLVFGGVKSFVGVVPVGNPGNSNVSPVQPFPIDPSIQKIFNDCDLE